MINLTLKRFVVSYQKIKRFSIEGYANHIIMKIFITGATGYLGGHFCEYFGNKGHEVTGFIRNPKKAKLLDSLSIPYKIGDITDQVTIEEAMKEGYDVVIHAAGYVTDRGSWNTFRKINVEGTRNVANAMVTTGIERLIHMSSIASYGQVKLNSTEEVEPKRHRWFKYGITKLESEEVLQPFDNLKITYIRPSHIPGRRDRGFVAILYHTMKRKTGRWINQGKSITGLVYVDDVCRAVELCIENPEKSVDEGYNVVSPEQTTVREIVEILSKEMGFPIPVKNIGFRRAFYMAGMFEFLSSIFKFKLPLSRMAVVLAGHDFHVSSAKLEQLGWKSTKTVEEMLKEWTEWRKDFEKNRKTSK